MLIQEGWEVNRKRVYRILREEQMLKEARFSRPWVEETGSLETAGPNERRYMDLTYLETTDRGPCPLVMVQDAYTRELGGYGLFLACGAMEAADAVDAAVLSRFPRTGRAEGLVLRSDGDPPFVAHRFQGRMRLLGITLQANIKRRPEQNGMIESTNGHLKADYFWPLEPTTFLETRARSTGLSGASTSDYHTRRWTTCRRRHARGREWKRWIHERRQNDGRATPPHPSRPRYPMCAVWRGRHQNRSSVR